MAELVDAYVWGAYEDTRESSSLSGCTITIEVSPKS